MTVPSDSPSGLDCVVVAGALPQEFLGTKTRAEMRLHLDGVPASLNVLARHSAGQSGGDLSGLRQAFIGLNGPYLCQYLADHGVRVARIDVLSQQQDEFARLLAQRPRVVILSTTFLPLAEQIDAIAQRIKEQAPWVTVVAGGPQVWKSYQHLLLAEAGGIDQTIAATVAAHNYLMDRHRPSPVDILVVARRGEAALAGLVCRLCADQPWQDLPNLAWYDQGAWQLGTRAEEEDLPVAIDWRRHPLPPGPIYLPVQAGQGCGFRCTFCDFCALHPQVTMRDPQDVIDEIRTMPEHDGLRRVYFTDDNLFATRTRAEAMLEALIDSGMSVRWRGMLRVDMVDDHIADLLRRSGALEVLLGIESGDPEILANMGKRLDPQRALSGLAALDRHGINTKSFFIVGFPGETPASIDRAIDFINAYPCQGPAVHRYTIFTFAPLPLAAIAQPAARRRWHLQGYGFRWRHATMDSDQAAQAMAAMFQRIKPDLSPSYPLEVPELPGLGPAELKRIYRLRSRLATLADAAQEPAMLAELLAICAACDVTGLVSAG